MNTSDKPEISMWQEVYRQAVADLITTSKHSTAESDRMKAAQWLFSSAYKDERRQICELAGVNYSSWRRELKLCLERVFDRNSVDLND